MKSLQKLGDRSSSLLLPLTYEWASCQGRWSNLSWLLPVRANCGRAADFRISDTQHKQFQASQTVCIFTLRLPSYCMQLGFISCTVRPLSRTLGIGQAKINCQHILHPLKDLAFNLHCMASHVVVLDSSARRAIIKTTPAKHLADVLHEACTKFGLETSRHGLK